jgi:hypothetical protein
MAKQEMSGKALLDKLYSGLDTMPAEKAAMDARDHRRLTDDFLGKPTESTSGEHVATSRSAVSARSGSRTKLVLSSFAALGLLALGGVMAAGALREPDKQAAALPPPPAAVVPVSEPAPVAQVAEAPPPEPVVLVNPFDKTEKFTFPPGTSKAEAREQMATMLLQRAAERGANRPRARKLAAEPKKSSTGHGS